MHESQEPVIINRACPPNTQCSQWISVDDRLPEYECHAGVNEIVHVIVCLNGNLVCEGMYIDGEWEVLGVKTKEVHHWMALPQPPVR